MAGTGTTENLVVVNRFDLEVDSVTIGHILSFSGISDTTDVVDAPTVTNKGKLVPQKMGGNTQYGDLQFSLHLTDEKYISDWMKEVEEMKFSTYRRNGSVIMYDTMGKEQVRVNFVNAFPTMLDVSGFAAGGNEAATMSVTLAHEGIELVFS
jgi:phage tail-like protein